MTYEVQIVWAQNVEHKKIFKKMFRLNKVFSLIFRRSIWHTLLRQVAK